MKNDTLLEKTLIILISLAFRCNGGIFKYLISVGRVKSVFVNPRLFIALIENKDSSGSIFINNSILVEMGINTRNIQIFIRKTVVN